MVVELVSGDVFGIEGRAVEIQVDLRRGLSNFVITGLPGKGIRESRERIRSAISNRGFRYPDRRRIVIHLAPAAWEKDGAVFDLPLALGILLADDQVRVAVGEWGAVGELSLDGRVRGIAGALGIARALRARGVSRLLVPRENLLEAAVVPGVEAVGVETLDQAVRILQGEEPGARADEPPRPQGVRTSLDFDEVVGHATTKRALAVAVAGEHNVLLVGPPGSGKSYMARRVPGLLPPLTPEEILEVTQIHSAAGSKREPGLIRERPFRAPHHTVSWAGLVGGGMTPRPGEITLAHRGVLFLDELPEFQRRSLEALREPLEEGEITIARSQATLRFPAEFLLVAAMNPCPCGFLGHARRRCHCTPDRIRRYGEKVSGPLLDRIDIRLAVESPAGARLLRSRSSQGPGTRELLALVEIATGFRRSQGRALPSRRLSWSSRDRWAPLDARCRALLEGAADSADLSTRGLTRVLRVARTVADMDRSASVEERHVLEALEYRSPSGGDGLFAYLENR